MLPLFASRSDYLSYLIEVGKPELCENAAGEAELERVARRCVERMERFIAAHPTQWFDFRRA